MECKIDIKVKGLQDLVVNKYQRVRTFTIIGSISRKIGEIEDDVNHSMILWTL